MKELRHYENFHIGLWLLKDTCWLMHYTIAGVIMIVPTVGMALWLAYKTYGKSGVFLPNLAVCCWIGANATWMLGEFFDFDFHVLALLFFLSGMVVIAWHFIEWKKPDPDVHP